MMPAYQIMAIPYHYRRETRAVSWRELTDYKRRQQTRREIIMTGNWPDRTGARFGLAR
jgi:hypothetical protein